MTIVAKSSTVWDQLEKIITVLAQLCILLMCLDVLSFRMGVLPGFIAVSGLYFMFVGCVLLCLAGFALTLGADCCKTSSFWLRQHATVLYQRR